MGCPGIFYGVGLSHGVAQTKIYQCLVFYYRGPGVFWSLSVVASGKKVYVIRTILFSSNRRSISHLWWCRSNVGNRSTMLRVIASKIDRPNRAVQLIAGRSSLRVEATVARRSGTGDAGSRASRVPSLPFPTIHHFRQPAIPDGGR